MVHISVKRLLSLVMKRHQQAHRSLYKTCKRMAKINLTKLFNKCVVKPYAKRQEKKFKNVYRDKIKTEYLFQEVANSGGSTDELAKKIKFIEFNDLNYPSLREQIVKSSKVYVNVAPEVSSTSYTLVKWTTEYEIIKMSSGRYLNFGVEKSLQNYLRSYPNLHFNNSCLDLSIGLYVIKSTTERGVELPRYLILFGKIANILQQTTPNNNINTSFIIAIYDGTFPTPTIANEILRPFVDEMKALTTKTPIEPFNGRKISRIGLHAFICDPIASSIFTCTSLPESLYGCSKCRVKSELRVNGQFNGNITTFPTSCKTENLRLDDDFKYCLDSDYHLDVPIALELNVGLVTQTSIDYKYTVCLGVMKQLVTLWTKGKLDYRINRVNWLRMLAHLEKIAQNCPEELQKPFNYSDDTETWDAYHWKLFLIYFGPIVLHNNLPWKYYIHFMYLHVAARIMINQYKSRKHSALIVGYFLNSFTTEFASLYGKHYVDYNVHNLIHFEDTIAQLGSIESVGGFSYEEQFNFVHSLIQYNQNITIEEIAEQIVYKNSCSITSLVSIRDKPYHIDEDRNLIFDNFYFNNKHPNNYILSKKGIFEINEIISNCNEQILIVGRKFHSLKNILSEYFAPFNEEKLVSVSESDYVEIITLDEITTKLIKFETNNGLFMMPLIRTS